MFFYRHNVSEPQLDKYGCWLYDQFLKGTTELVATCGDKIKVHKVFDKSDGQLCYFILDHKIKVESKEDLKKQNPAVMGFCSLSKLPRWKALETTMLYVSPLWRRSGVALMLYDAIMKDGVVLMSGYSHNPKSRALWVKLVQNERYTTWAHDILDLKKFSPIMIDDNGDFDCKLKIYEDIKKLRRRRKQDVRIIAFNPKYA